MRHRGRLSGRSSRSSRAARSPGSPTGNSGAVQRRRDAAGEAAFAALVTRHGPMVLDICRQLLGDRHHAEDAFQAVFLVLARKARSIRNPDLLGNWLYGVALRTARKAKVRLARRRKNEEEGSMRRPGFGIEHRGRWSTGRQPALDREDVEALHDEIDRLPGSFRLPVVLCYFEGLTLDEAARRLRCPAGHGPQPAGPGARQAPPRPDPPRRGLAGRRAGHGPEHQIRLGVASHPPCAIITTKAAIQFAAGQAASPLAASLAREVLRAMLIHKLRFTIVTLLLLAAFATGAGYLTHSLAMKDEPKRTPAASQPPAGGQARRRARVRPRAGCSWSAACSTRKASRCRARP